MKMEKVMVKQEPNTSTTEQEFTTTPSRTVTDIEQQQGGNMTEGTKTVPKTVTPPEAPSVKEERVEDENNEKQVRFGDDQIKKEDSESSSKDKDKNTTRRNRPVKVESSRGAVLEFKTYRSPSRKRDEEVPSLCSTGSDAPAEKAPKTAKPASSISVDPSKDTTSPLASHDAEKNEKEVTRETADSEVSATSFVFRFNSICGL